MHNRKIALSASVPQYGNYHRVTVADAHDADAHDAVPTGAATAGSQHGEHGGAPAGTTTATSTVIRSGLRFPHEHYVADLAGPMLRLMALMSAGARARRMAARRAHRTQDPAVAKGGAR